MRLNLVWNALTLPHDSSIIGCISTYRRALLRLRSRQIDQLDVSTECSAAGAKLCSSQRKRFGQEAKQGSPGGDTRFIKTPFSRIAYKMNIPAPGWRNWQTQRT
jgi:hypothetical protein